MTIRAAIRGRHLGDLRQYLASLPVTLVEGEPELVISYGGDGALLGAEREFPGVPKFPLRDSRTCGKCPEHSEQVLLERLVSGGLQETHLGKIEAVTGDGRCVTALNDIIISKQIICSCVRGKVWLDDQLYARQIVADGVVAATPFGSTGYYRSITHSVFQTGIGIAFNNSTEPTDHLVVKESTTVRVVITRGPAVLLGDNAPQRIPLHEGDEVLIRRSGEEAVILGLDSFRCAACYELRELSAVACILHP
jgi:NAD+ kinase